MQSRIQINFAHLCKPAIPLADSSLNIENMALNLAIGEMERLSI